MVREERQEILRELSILSAEQRKVLIAVANGQTSELTGKIFLKKINLSSSSVIEALKILEHRDYLEKRETGEYHVIDPLLATALRLYFANLP